MPLTYRRMQKSEKSYALRLARDEINIEPKRLGEHKTYLIYHDGERIGYVSFRFNSDQTVYIYILALEKQAQRKGFAAAVLESLMQYGQQKSNRFSGLSATVHKVNDLAINAASKHGFRVTGERARYYDFIKPAASLANRDGPQTWL